MTDRTPVRLLYPLAAVEPLPKLVSLPADDDVFVDDPNPRGLPIYHPSGICTSPSGDCRPRILATCAGCGAELNHCLPSEVEIAALKRGAWRCAACGGGA